MNTVMGFLVTIRQLPKPFVDVMSDLSAKGRLAAETALYREAETIMTISRELTPVDTGALRGSAHVDMPESRGSRVEVRMGFGGVAMDYALIVHEDLDVPHVVGQAKFLEGPARDETSSGRSAARMQQTMQEVLR